MDFVVLVPIGLGAMAGFAFSRFLNALIFTGLIGLGFAIAYHLYLHADPSRRDALELVGYVFAFFYPLGGCVLGRAARRLTGKSE